MNQKQIGIVLIILGAVLLAIFITNKVEEENRVRDIITEKGTCFLDDGTCLHQRNQTLFVIGTSLSIAIILFGLYLAFVDRTQAILAEHQKQVSGALQEAKKDERFKAFLSGFPEEEQKVLSAVKDQPGILQSTLRFRTGISKTALSNILQSLEKRNMISREESGKSKKVHLQKKF